MTDSATGVQPRGARVRLPRMWRFSPVLVVGLVTLLAACTDVSRSPWPTSATSAAATVSTKSRLTTPVSGTPARPAVAAAPATIRSMPAAPARPALTCPVAADRALAVLVPQLPRGTSVRPSRTIRCTGGVTLAVTYPAAKPLAWEVQVTVSRGRPSDCDHGAAGASQQCRQLYELPGAIGADAVCGALECEQAWLFAGGYLVMVFSWASSDISDRLTRPAESSRSIGTGTAVLSALGA